MKHKLTKKILLLYVVAIVSLAVVGLGLYKLALTGKATKLPNNVATKSSSADNNANNQRKASSQPSSTLNSGSSLTPPSSSYGTTSSNNSGTTSTSPTISITRAGVINSNLQVGTLVNGTTSGKCELYVSQSGQTTITSTNQVTLEGNSYVCPVFSLPVSQFPNQGSWNVSVTLISGSNEISTNWVDNPVNL